MLAQMVPSNVRELEGTPLCLAAKSSLTGRRLDVALARAEISVGSFGVREQERLDRMLSNWTVDGNLDEANWITSERPYVKFAAPLSWHKRIEGDWVLFKCPDGTAAFAFTTFNHSKDATARLRVAADILSIDEVKWSVPTRGRVESEGFAAQVGEGSCNFNGPGGYIWYAIVDTGAPDQILLIYTVTANGSEANKNAALSSIKSITRR